MRDYIIRRLMLAVPTIFLMSLLVFLLVQLIPGSVIELMLADMQFQYKERDIENIKQQLGIDVPIHVQYGRWIWGVFQGDLGRSLWTNRPVSSEIIARLPVSIELGILAILTALLIAIPIGVYSGVRQDTGGDYAARSLAIMCIALPSFWIGTMVMVFPSIWLNWTPSMEYIPFAQDPVGNLIQFIIPAVILGMYLSGTTMRMTRTMMLEVLRQDYVRTAWAKGLKEGVVVYRHVLKNALIPVVTIIGLQMPILIGGTVILEQIFCLPGVGRYLLEAINRRDYIVLSGVNLFIGSFVLLVNLVVDLTYAFLDPRIHYK